MPPYAVYRVPLKMSGAEQSMVMSERLYLISLPIALATLPVADAAILVALSEAWAPLLMAV